MSRSIPSQHQRVLCTARENLIRQQETTAQNDEVLRAKWLQKQTGCTWTEALRAARRAAEQQ